MAKPWRIVPTKGHDTKAELYTLLLSAHGCAIVLAALKNLLDSEGHLMTKEENEAILDMVDMIKNSLDERKPDLKGLMSG
jgi:hypothetical protein